MTPQDADTGSSPADTAVPSAENLPAATNAGNQAPDTSGDNTASPPNAPVDDRAGLLEVVRNAVQAAPKTPLGEDAPAAPDTTVQDPDAPLALDVLDTDPTDAELAALVPRTKARIERLLSQRADARAEVETLRPAAERWQHMDEYLTRHELAAEDVNLLLGVGAALRRGDFKAFRDGVMPYVELANQALGIDLPPDLQLRVDSGEIAPEDAAELSTSRFATARQQSQAEAQQTATTAQRQAEQDTARATSLNEAVVTWEQDVRTRDPDYARKVSAVVRISQAMIAEHGRPTTTDGAVELAKAAYAEANRMFAGVTPAPIPTRETPHGAPNRTNARPEPKTFAEAARAGLARSRAN